MIAVYMRNQYEQKLQSLGGCNNTDKNSLFAVRKKAVLQQKCNNSKNLLQKSYFGN